MLPLTPGLGVNVSEPSAAMVTVPVGSVTGWVAPIGWPPTATMVIAVVEASLLRGSNATGVPEAVDSVSAFAVGGVRIGSIWACGVAGRAAGRGGKLSEPGVVVSASRPT